jgi:hypothetical protein
MCPYTGSPERVALDDGPFTVLAAILSNSRRFICRVIRRIPQKNAALIGLTTAVEDEMAHFHGGRVLCSNIVPRG